MSSKSYTRGLKAAVNLKKISISKHVHHQYPLMLHITNKFNYYYVISVFKKYSEITQNGI